MTSDRYEEAEGTKRAARLFDVRRVIGGLFVVYGVIVTLLGIFDSPAEINKASGVRINLWMGLAMLAVGLLMLLWQWLSPVEAPSRGETPAEGDSSSKGEGGERAE